MPAGIMVATGTASRMGMQKIHTSGTIGKAGWNCL